jgi:myo-inositol-1(or 4)-monophosphatase
MIDQELIAFANALADAARAETLPRWRDAGASRNKADNGSYDPVTEADIASELAMRRLIETHYPDHGIAGEEMPDRPSTSGWTWSLDPIDGTRSFVCGMPSWVTLIALLRDGEPVLGVIDAPRLDERYIGHGSIAGAIDRSATHKLAVSGCTRLAQARFSSTDPGLFTGTESEAFEQIKRRVRTIRYGHDGYAYARLAAGSIDLVVESGLKPFDYNALVPVIRAAGGFVGNWRGDNDLSAGQIVAAATQPLFEETIRILEAAAR